MLGVKDLAGGQVAVFSHVGDWQGDSTIYRNEGVRGGAGSWLLVGSQSSSRPGRPFTLYPELSVPSARLPTSARLGFMVGS